MEAFPAFFPLAGARIVVAGTGRGAEARRRLLAGSPAEVLTLEGVAAEDPIRYSGAALAFVASPDALFRRTAAEAARAAGVPVNVLDEPALCDFHTPAIIDRGAVVAAVGSSGAAPLLSATIRTEIESLLPETLGALAGLLGHRREAIRARYPDLAERRAFLRRVIASPIGTTAHDDPDQASRFLDEAIAGEGRQRGSVTVILEPANVDLLSLRSRRAIGSADVLIASGPQSEWANLARRDVELRDLGDTRPREVGGLAIKGLRVAVIVSATAERFAGDLRAFGVDVFVQTPGAAS